MDWTPLAWFAAALVALLWLEQQTHRHLQGVALLVTGHPDAAVELYSLPLLPGIVLHEASHALAALLVGVRVGRIALRPARAEGRIQLGFVPVEATGPVRTAIIGLAPLLTGCLALLLIGGVMLRLGAAGAALSTGDWVAVLDGLRAATHARDFWVWAYLAFSISNTMLPSRSDMRAWPVVAVSLALTVALMAALGAVAPLAGALRWLAIACGLTVLLDLPFVLLIFLLEWGLSRAKGVRVEYQ